MACYMQEMQELQNTYKFSSTINQAIIVLEQREKISHTRNTEMQTSG